MNSAQKNQLGANQEYTNRGYGYGNNQGNFRDKADIQPMVNTGRKNVIVTDDKSDIGAFEIGGTDRLQFANSPTARYPRDFEVEEIGFWVNGDFIYSY